MKNHIARLLVLMTSIGTILTSLQGCSQQQDPLSADLAFVLSSEGSFDQAISSATSSDGERDYSHVAILYEDGGAMMVIEAVPGRGVCTSTLESFLSINRNVDIYRVQGVEFSPEETIRRAQSFIGQKYDYTYLPENSMMYCSELVFDSYLDERGNNIFRSKPMNFMNPDGTLDGFWADLFDGLGMDVPQNIPGTNPNDMSRDRHLALIREYRQQ